MQIRTRFAPSPTGVLHIGSVRTALFAWLYARQFNGVFLLRIEDTDQERSTKDSVAAILDGMAWLGLDYDEGPYFQTDRYPRYLEVISTWIEEGKAYRCSCSTERLDELRSTQLANKQKPRYDGHCKFKSVSADLPYVVRFSHPSEGMISFHDEVYGDIEVSNDELDDLVILRSDGHPTYNFAVVVDDHDMQITHVIRGDDHINNTPKQIAMFHALGADVPVFAHLPMILGADGKRLSKRHGAVGVMQFKDSGFLPSALLNYLVRLGWSHGDQEIFSLGEMIAQFDFAHVNRAASAFDYDKLAWLNQHYEKTEPVDRVAELLAYQFRLRGLDTSKGPSLEAIVPLQAERYKTLSELCDHSLYFYTDLPIYDENAVKTHLNPEGLMLLNLVQVEVKNCVDWNKESAHALIQGIVTKQGIGFAKLAQPLRVALTGNTMSPSIDITMVLIGKDRVLLRLAHVLEGLGNL